MKIIVKQVKMFDAKLLKELTKRTVGRVVTPNRRFFKDKNNILIVATLESDLAGYAWAFKLYHPDRLQSAMFLYSMDVFGEYQRRGIGTRLIGELKRLAIRNRCFEIFVLTEEDNHRAIEFYKRTGGLRDKNNSVMFTYKCL